MASAFGHFVRPLTEKELNYLSHRDESDIKFYETHGRPLPEGYNYHQRCKVSSKCKNLAEMMLTYQYVTGRAGRVTSAEKPCCQEHALKYEIKI